MHLVSLDSQSSRNQAGDPQPEDFSRLVTEHHRDLLVYAVALVRDTATARDLVQEAFITAYDKIEVFDVTRDFASWMRGIVRNKWREWLRRERKYDLSDIELARIDAAVAIWQQRRTQGHDPLSIALETCLTKLPEDLLETVELYYYEGLTGDEAADRLHLAPAAIRKRLQRARTMLKQCLEMQTASSH